MQGHSILGLLIRVCAGVMVLLGAHGVYLASMSMERLMLRGLAVGGRNFEESFGCLFLQVCIPQETVRKVILWMSQEGLTSWFMPVAVLVVGGALFVYGERLAAALTSSAGRSSPKRRRF